MKSFIFIGKINNIFIFDISVALSDTSDSMRVC